jgi:hypothetical protein
LTDKAIAVSKNELPLSSRHAYFSIERKRPYIAIAISKNSCSGANFAISEYALDAGVVLKYKLSSTVWLPETELPLIAIAVGIYVYPSATGQTVNELSDVAITALIIAPNSTCSDSWDAATGSSFCSLRH